MCSNLAFVCNYHLQKEPFYFLGGRWRCNKGSVSSGGALSDLNQTSQVHFRGWSAEKGAFFSMICLLTFVDTCRAASFDQSRVPWAAVFLFESCLFLISLEALATCVVFLFSFWTWSSVSLLICGEIPKCLSYVTVGHKSAIFKILFHSLLIKRKMSAVRQQWL